MAGYGSAAQPDAAGYFYCQLKGSSGTTDINGKVRLILENAAQTKKVPIYEQRTEVLDASATDRRQMAILPACGVWMGEDSRITLQFMSDNANGTQVNGSGSTVYLPVTLKYF
jgi:hypothetical protein